MQDLYEDNFKTLEGITKKDFNKSKMYYVLRINFTSARC